MTFALAVAVACATGLLGSWLQRQRFKQRMAFLANHIEELDAAAERLVEERERVKRTARDREVLLGRALDVAPIAILLLNEVGRISLANDAARALFFEGVDPTGNDFLSLLGRAPDALRRAIANDGDVLFSIDDSDGERQTYHLSRRWFPLGGEPHVLVMVKNLSRELNRQEAEVWRRMIRLFSHELNNSLAPVSSLLHSAEFVVAGSPLESKLALVFATIRERADHLRTFLESYAQFARLPAPRKKMVDWAPFLARISALWPELDVDCDLPTQPGWFDEAQMEQVLLNLVKNAYEAGGGEVIVAVTPLANGGVYISVSDRGPGMTEEVMRNALVPFYSTKEGGTGLGLPLSREIVDAHGGRLRIDTREGGGLCVRVRLPGIESSCADSAGRLTLSRI
jgi:two-component system nitrogen regulation sensor histidine kinase NtrY